MLQWPRNRTAYVRVIEAVRLRYREQFVDVGDVSPRARLPQPEQDPPCGFGGQGNIQHVVHVLAESERGVLVRQLPVQRQPRS